MKILFVFHYCSPKINDIAWGPIYLGTQGNDVLVLTSQHVQGLKGEHSAPEVEIVGRTEFFRPYSESIDLVRRPSVAWRAVEDKLSRFAPDVIIAFGEFALKLPLRISKHFSIPLILYMENLRADKLGLPLRGRTLLARFAPGVTRILGRAFLRFLSRRVSAIMFAYYGDQDLIPSIEKLGIRAFYVPWCNEVSPSWEPTPRDRSIGVYIGSLERFKNSRELVSAIPLILEQTITTKFIVVGPGSFSKEIRELSRYYGKRMEYFPTLPRNEALHILRTSGYGYTPVRHCGLGFIGDCWGTETPLITTHDLDGFLRPGEDTVIAPGVTDLPRAINELLTDPEKYTRYQLAGLERHRANYTASAVGSRYLQVLHECGITNILPPP